MGLVRIKGNFGEEPCQIIDLMSYRRSFRKILKSINPRIEPYGTPDTTFIFTTLNYWMYLAFYSDFYHSILMSIVILCFIFIINACQKIKRKIKTVTRD